jgi:hypothetical protein
MQSGPVRVCRAAQTRCANGAADLGSAQVCITHVRLHANSCTPSWLLRASWLDWGRCRTTPSASDESLIGESVRAVRLRHERNTLLR